MQRAPDERAVAVAREGEPLALDGIFLGVASGSAADGAVIAPPHPLYGGSMHSPVVNEIAYACQISGIASLRFDWRGIGASAGQPSGSPRDAADDFAAALAHLEETVNGELLACGYSFGAAAALRAGAGRSRVTKLILVAPPPGLLDPETLGRFAGRVLILTGGADAIAPARELEALAARARRGSFAAIPDAEHFFATGLSELGRELRTWLGGAGTTSRTAGSRTG
jgi:alpha/beta superfamily hydrolase